MGSSQSRDAAASVTPVSTKEGKHKKDGESIIESKVLDTPIFMDDDDKEDQHDPSLFPTPTGHEYDLMDQIAAELPSVIDEESKQQVQDYKDACNNGRGPMVACFATAEYLSLFERKHKEAAALFEQTCFRPKNDKSPNGVLVDRTKAYPPACFNLAQMRMTGKGGTAFDRTGAYQLFDRACRGGHDGACHYQAKMLSSEPPGALGPKIPYDPKKASDLLQRVCNNGDSISCFTLATMLLRGDRVKPEATNVSPDEARGLKEIQQREHEPDRSVRDHKNRRVLERDPPRAERILQQACLTSGHAPSCYNLAVMYSQGDDGIPANPEKAKEFQDKTEELVNRFGGFGM